MHTDDDIFESLEIEEGSGTAGTGTGSTEGPASGSPGDAQSESGSYSYAPASDDIFESLDMEDRIYNTSFLSGTPDAHGAQHDYSAGSGDNDLRPQQSSEAAGNGAAQSRRGAQPQDIQSAPDSSAGSRSPHGSRPQAAGQLGQSQASSADSDRRSRGRGKAELDDTVYGGGTASSGNGRGRGGRKSPRELNTADTSIDGRKYARDKENKKKSRIRKIIICSVLELFTLAAIFVYGYLLRTWNLIARPEVRIEAVENNNISVEKKKEMEGYWNIAVFGVDSRGSSVVERGINSDVIMVVSINKDTGDIKIVSVFRDTYLNISDKNSYNKINQAYAIGGPEQALAALNKNLDLNIQHYVAFNWKAVADGINILGGVDNIPISKAELYYINAYITETVKVTKIGSVQLTHTGEQHLDGVQAVAYGRLRYMDNDFARTERQRNILKAAFAKAKTAGFSVLNNIMVVCFPQVATNIDFGEAIDMAQHITQYNIADTGGFPWSRGDANIGSKGDCVVPTTLESNVVKLHEFLFGDTNYTPSSAVLSISDKIKSDSGKYKEGKVIESVSTDGGVIQKKKTPAETKSPAEEDAEESSKTSSKNSKSTIGVDEDGNYIYPTDSEGNIVVPTDSSGKVIYPTDSEGNVIKETSAARPTELSTDDMSPGDPEESDEPADGPISSTTAANGAANPGHSSNTGQTGTTSGNESAGPNSHTAESTTASGTHSQSSPSDSTPGGTASPGGNSTTSSEGPSSNTGSSSNSGSSQISSEPIISSDGPGSISTGSTDGPGASGSNTSNAPG